MNERMEEGGMFPMLSFKNPKNRLGGIKEIIFLHEFPHERWFASGIHGELTPT